MPYYVKTTSKGAVAATATPFFFKNKYRYLRRRTKMFNVAITQIVVEQNQWIANAKASAQTYGAWSVYYGIDFSKLSPIEIKRE